MTKEERQKEIVKVQQSKGQLLASIEKARNLLGYNPQFNIKEGLEEAVKWYWENL